MAFMRQLRQQVDRLGKLATELLRRPRGGQGPGRSSCAPSRPTSASRPRAWARRSPRRSRPTSSTAYVFTADGSRPRAILSASPRSCASSSTTPSTTLLPGHRRRPGRHAAQRTRAAVGDRLRDRDQARRPGARVRALLHLRRRPGARASAWPSRTSWPTAWRATSAPRASPGARRSRWSSRCEGDDRRRRRPASPWPVSARLPGRRSWAASPPRPCWPRDAAAGTRRRRPCRASSTKVEVLEQAGKSEVASISWDYDASRPAWSSPRDSRRPQHRHRRGPGLGLRHLRQRRDRHQRPRRHQRGRRHQEGHERLRALRRRQPGPGAGQGLRPVRRRRPAEDRSQRPDVAPAAARLDEGPARGSRWPPSAAPRQGAVALGRGHLRARPLHRVRLPASTPSARSRPTSPINHGNPGCSSTAAGALGINAQIQTSTGDGSGVGFAVPADAVDRRSLAQPAPQRTPAPPRWTSGWPAWPSTRSLPGASTCP